ncbi:cysteine desulfurase [Modicisalibacter xianhensis]|uniref:cysteine desulfurase n=1 Tax=Modicisalibacter xianhensis TaxID=442341 RepID=A0A4R8FFN9_9GAMM|nr:cysteine desulfurase family protein [Halomonas xianhensis]TDX24766.1 cysteine desulfurase [Halomonas xianhensis]
MLSPVYLDYNATTPVATEVAMAMGSALRECYGNPSSGYRLGQQAAKRVTDARQSVASLIGANAENLVFTGCATEANNLALLGLARASAPEKRHLVISATEHPSVMAPARHLEAQGWALTIVPVDKTGRVASETIADAVRPETALVSVMLANNEVGTLQPIAEIAKRLRGSGALLHTDAAQAVGKISVDVDALGVDLLTVAGHKFQAGKGIGALYVRKGTPIQQILFGAGHESGLRPGTENVPAIIGLGVAAELAAKRLAQGDNILRERRDQLHGLLSAAIPGLQLNGHPEQRLPNTLNVSFPRISGQALLAAASDAVMASVGSACHAGESGPSGVLGAMGLNPERALGAVRLSVGWETHSSDIERAAYALVNAWQCLDRSHS